MAARVPSDPSQTAPSAKLISQAQERLGDAARTVGNDPVAAAEMCLFALQDLRDASHLAQEEKNFANAKLARDLMNEAEKRFTACERHVDAAKTKSTSNSDAGGGFMGAIRSVLGGNNDGGARNTRSTKQLQPPKNGASSPTTTTTGPRTRSTIAAAAPSVPSEFLPPRGVQSLPTRRTGAAAGGVGDAGSAFSSVRGGGAAAAAAVGAKRTAVGRTKSNGVAVAQPNAGNDSELAAKKEAILRQLAPGIDVEMAKMILNDVVDHSPCVAWDDIAGLKAAKDALVEIAILPLQRPDIFNGIRAPPRGLLLFGPPGTGKTMLAKAVAHTTRYTFFSISASSLTSKWHGVGEKLVRTLFAMAAQLQPSVIFVDEVDSLLCARGEGEHEASRRLKTEFLVQFDGVGSVSDAKILVMGATNRPQELDEAVRRRFTKRLYIPLPDTDARLFLVRHLLKGLRTNISDRELQTLGCDTDGYSGSDLTALVKDAAMGPLRELSPQDVMMLPADAVRPVTAADFRRAMTLIRPSVSPSELRSYEEWNAQFGALGV